MVIPTQRQVICRIISVMFYRLWLYRKRHFMVTLIQIIMPPLILFFFATFHSSMFLTKTKVPNVTTYPELSEQDLFQSICNDKCGIEDSTVLAIKLPPELRENFTNILKGRYLTDSSFKFVHVDSEEDMIKLAIGFRIPNIVNYVGGVVVKTSTCESKHEFPCVEFKIRLAIPIPSEISASDFNNLDDSKVQEYYPFMGLQLAFFRTLMESINSNYSRMSLSVQGYPYPSHIKFSSNLPVTTNRLFLSISFVLGMTFLVYSAVRAPCNDKQSGFKVYMNLMGLPNWAFWLQWFLNDLFVQCIVVGLEMLLLFLEFNENLGIIVKHGNPIIWAIFLILYGLASISFVIFMASFFRRGILATYTTATIWLLSYYFADLYLPSYIVSFSRYSKIAMCLIPNAALIWGLTLLTSNAGGIDWTNITHRLDATGITLLEVLIMLAVATVFYYIMTNYTDALRPGVGPERPWYYIFKEPTCWAWTFTRRRRESHAQLDEVNQTDNYFVSKVDAAIKFDGLTRQYRGNKAVLDVTMRIKEDKCTVICGHNGSGKTTLLYLLCGGLPPSRGTAYVLGYSIKSQMSIIQSFTSISISSVHNFLCEDMTIMEHLLLVGKLKGLSHQRAVKDARKYLHKLDLHKKCNRFPNYLLDFELRKLSVIMAMMGKSQIVLLDEPTRGMEEDMKRSVWDFILDFRNKTILVTTSSIEEAYALGSQSRVAVLALGRVVALGSPLHLENLFVTGYHLKIRVPIGTDPIKINNFVRTQILSSDFVEPEHRRLTRVLSLVDNDFDSPEIEVHGDDVIPNPMFTLENPNDPKSRISGEGIALDLVPFAELTGIENDADSETEVLSIQLPKTEVSRFSDLFLLLENPNVINFLQIIDWKLELYAIDTAFRDAHLYQEWAESDFPEDIHEDVKWHEDNERLNPYFTALNRFKALVIKRLLWMRGTWIYVLVQYLSPILLLIVTIQGTNTAFKNSLEKSEVTQTLQDNFPNPIILFTEDGNSGFSKAYQSLESQAIFERYETNSLADLILSKSEAQLSSTYVVGAEIKQNSVNARFSTTAFHAGPISLSLALSAYVKFAFPQNNFGIISSSHPIESNRQELLKFYIAAPLELETTDEALTFAIMIGFGLFVFTSGFILQPQAERACGLKKLQLNTGLSKLSYWTSLLVCDMTLLFILICFLVLILQFLPDHNAFMDIEFRKYFAGIYLLAGYGSIMQSYVASFILRQPKTCIYGMLSYNQVVGIFTLILGTTLIGLGSIILQLIFKMAFFGFNVPSAFYSLMLMTREKTQCNLLSQTFKDVLCVERIFIEGNKSFSFDVDKFNKTCCDSHCKDFGHCTTIGMDYILDQYYGFGIGADLLFLGLHAILMTVLLYLTESGFLKRILESQSKSSHSSSRKVEEKWGEEFNESVKQERENLKQIKSTKAVRNQYLLVDSISLTYYSCPVLSNINLVAQPGEIIAIVGRKGSGKTSLMKVLAKFVCPNYGNVFCQGKSLRKNRSSTKYLQKIGYCPAEITQIYCKISGLQLMRLFGRLRGIPESKLESHVSKWLNLLGLRNRAGGRFEFYTDSMKRKLLLALALIGDPPILFLDDPLKNLDPLSKVQFWSIMKNISTNSKRIIILTSSRTDDLAQHVGRMAVLVNGAIQSILSPAEMMVQYGKGFTITIRLKENPVQAGFDDYVNLKERVENNFSATILEEEQYTLKYKIPQEKYKWSQLFKIAEEIRIDFTNIVEDYTIRETELDDVYKAMVAKQWNFLRGKTGWDEFCSQYC